jgi:hypothetical protein
VLVGVGASLVLPVGAPYIDRSGLRSGVAETTRAEPPWPVAREWRVPTSIAKRHSNDVRVGPVPDGHRGVGAAIKASSSLRPTADCSTGMMPVTVPSALGVNVREYTDQPRGGLAAAWGRGRTPAERLVTGVMLCMPFRLSHNSLRDIEDNRLINPLARASRFWSLLKRMAGPNS